jgi:hypothetical protein
VRPRWTRARSRAQRTTVQGGQRQPPWDPYAGDFGAGVPLPQRSDAGVDLEPAGRMVGRLVETLAASGTTDKLAADTRILDAELRQEAGAPRRMVDWLLGEESFAPSAPGLLRYLGASHPTAAVRSAARGSCARRGARSAAR